MPANFTGSLAISGSLIISGSILTSGSITISGSIASASYAEFLGGLPSSSFASASVFNQVSASFSSTSGSIAGRVNIIETSYATTGSNNFTRPQQISDVSNAISFTSTASLYTAGGLRVSKDSFVSGTAYFNNVVVYGTSSIQYITSSQVNIGTNIITVNTDTPAVRFGGLAVFDSGSTQLTGSLLWDSEANRWIYSNPSGSTYSGGMLISGPRAASLGTEVGTTACAVMIGQGGDHITSSGIFSYANATCFYGNSFISSSGAACFNNITGSSSQFNGNVSVVGISCFSSTVCTPTLLSCNGTIFLQRGANVCNGLIIGEQGGSITADKASVIRTAGGTSEHLFITPGINANTNACGYIRLGGDRYTCVGINSAPTYTMHIQGFGDHRLYHYNCGNTSSDKAVIQAEVCGDTSGNAYFAAGKTGVAWSFGRNTTTGNFEVRSNWDLANDTFTRFQITSTGIACFGCRVCARNLSISSTSVFSDETYFLDKVGIGTQALYNKLDILQNGSSANTVTGLGLKIYGDANTNVVLGLSQTARGTVSLGMQAASVAPATFVLGTDVCGDLIFKNQLSSYCDLSTGTSLLFICRNGNVGIGTTSPAYQLEVSLPSSVNGQIIRMNRSAGAYGWGLGMDSNSVFGIYDNGGTLRLGITSTGLVGINTNNPFSFGSTSGMVDVRSQNSTSVSGVFISNSDASARIVNYINCAAGAFIGTSTFHYLDIGTCDTSRLRISTTGIASFSCQICAPNAVLNCLGVGSPFSTTGGTYQTLQLKAGLANSGLWVESCENDSGLYINHNSTSALVGGSYRTSAGFKDLQIQTAGATRIMVKCSGAVYINSSANQLNNATPALGILAGATCDAVNIKHEQNGNNSVNIWQTGTSNFGAIVFYKGNTQDERGNITVSTTGTTFNSVSDYRLKENVTPSAYGLDRLMLLKPSKFNWIENGIEAEGFIAHELQEVFPDAVTGEKDGVYSSTGKIKPQSVDYGRITPLLVKAIQEQTCVICTLKTCLGII